MNMNKKYLYPAIGGVIVFIIVVGIILTSKPRTTAQNNSAIQPTVEAIPTVDASVKVSLSADAAKKEVTLSIQGIPASTAKIEYELSYQAMGKGSQGAIGNATLTGGETEYQKKITLGTCSSGTCVYHTVEGPVSLSLKFSGSYGEKLFQKDFQLQ
ncbi:hypothetical protein HGA88_03050 [Candidatus Roizmanbacteria bacterium]|nr:hypothetical protein [Candidatus Roizmanbacteria bacterium]